MIVEIGTTVVPLTQALAVEFAEMLSWAGERRLNADRLRMLSQVYAAGNFDAPTWAFAWLCGQKIRVNGQHTSTMLVQQGVRPNLRVVVKEYRVDTNDDLGQLFCRFDPSWSARNASDVTQALTTGVDIPLVPRRSIASAMSFVLSNYRPVRDVALRAEAIHADEKFASWAFTALRGSHLARVSVFAAAFATWRVDAARCQEFWTRVADESEPETDNATRVLARKLRDEKAIGPGGKTHGSNYAVRLTAMCVSAWNAWVSGRALQMLKYMGGNVPRVIGPTDASWLQK